MGKDGLIEVRGDISLLWGTEREAKGKREKEKGREKGVKRRGGGYGASIIVLSSHSFGPAVIFSNTYVYLMSLLFQKLQNFIAYSNITITSDY